MITDEKLHVTFEIILVVTTLENVDCLELRS